MTLPRRYFGDLVDRSLTPMLLVRPRPRHRHEHAGAPTRPSIDDDAPTDVLASDEVVRRVERHRDRSFHAEGITERSSTKERARTPPGVEEASAGRGVAAATVVQRIGPPALQRQPDDSAVEPHADRSSIALSTVPPIAAATRVRSVVATDIDIPPDPPRRAAPPAPSTERQRAEPSRGHAGSAEDPRPSGSFEKRARTVWAGRAERRRDVTRGHDEVTAIHVTIGRVEVRAVPGGSDEQAAPTRPSVLPLDEYLRQRSRGRRS